MRKTIAIALSLLACVGLLHAETDAKAMKVIRDIQRGVNNKNQITALRVLDSVTVGGNVTVAGTMALTGAATISGALDVDSVTVDAGAGLDTQAAGALLIGAATATNVVIADTNVTTDIEGDLEVQGDIDTAAASTLTLGGSAATNVSIADTGVLTDIQGTLSVDEAATFDATVTVTGAATFGRTLQDEVFGESVTNGQVLSIAYMTHVLNGIGGANDTTNTITLANPGTPLLGHEVRLIVNGSSSNLIGLADAGNLKLSSAWVGDNYDVIKLYAAETNVWVQTGEQDN